MIVPNRRLTCQAIFCFCVAAAATGCNAMNDNPINPDKMNQIRQQESRDRGNFKPQVPSQPANR